MEKERGVDHTGGVTNAIVVGSGPNGLAAAVTLAAAGLDVTVLEAAAEPGGGTRSGELTLPGVLHDACSGFHPLALDSAFANAVDLGTHGLSWRHPEVQYAHPLDRGTGGAAYRDVDRTARHLFDDGEVWQRVFGPLTASFGQIAEDFLRPMLHVPEHPLALARFGAFAGLPAAVAVQLWHTPEARALFAGAAAHAFRPFTSLASSAIGMALGTAAHAFGWPVAEGGSQAISRALIAALEHRGGRVETGVQVRSLRDLGDAEVIMLDLAPAAAVELAGDALPAHVAQAYRRYRHGPGAFVMHFAVEGGIPWSYEPARRAGTVHVGGTAEEVAHAERLVDRGEMPARPFVLVGQQYLADPGRSSADVHPIDSYAHVPTGFTGDAAQAIEDQIERFAPGFRERIVARHVRTPADLQAHNANYSGGDIITGANSALQLLFRPRIALDPYATGIPGVHLCSAATPPGAGAHGMCGYNAAQSALRSVPALRSARRSGPGISAGFRAADSPG